LVLPFAVYGLLFATLRKAIPEWRHCCLAAAVIWGVFVAWATEILSLAGWVTRSGVALAWVVFCAGCICAWRIVERRPVPPAPPATVRPDGISQLFLWATGIIVAVVGLTAILSPPNTRDAMMYHLPRVVEWIDHRSIAFYPTADYQQLTMAPWAEYVMLHLDLLYGGDRLVNLVQWFGYAGSIVGVSLIAGLLGAERRGQVFAAVCCATIPTAILAASGPKNDLVLSFWLVTGTYFLLRWKDEPNWSNTLGYSAAFALSIFTKATALIYLPCLAAACWWMAKRPERRQFIVRIPGLILLVLAINGPLMIRNYRLSGSPLGFASASDKADPQSRSQFTNGSFSIAGAASNLIRNVALHAGTPSDAVNRRVEACAVWMIRRMGEDPNDAEMLAYGKGGEHFSFQVVPMNRHETQAGNLLHFGYAILAILILLYRRRGSRREVWLLSGAVAGAFALFCAAIRWMPSNGRLHLPAFILGAAMLGVVLPAFCPRRLAVLAGWVLLLGALPFVAANKARPLLALESLHDGRAEAQRYGKTSLFQRTREELYFADAANTLAASYMAASKEALSTGCRDIGIDASIQHFEYPLFALVHADTGGPSVRYVGVTNRSIIYTSAKQPPPCVVICPGCVRAPEKWGQYKGIGGRASVFDDVVVFGAAGRLANSGAVAAELHRGS
jgi:hypothetical protein